MKKRLVAFWSIFSQIARSRSVLVIFVISIVLIALSFAVPYVELYPQILTKQAVPLHYNIHFGVDSFGVWWRVFMPSIVGVVILIINSLLAVFYWKRERMLSYCALAIMPILGVFILLSSIFITLLNLSYD